MLGSVIASDVELFWHNMFGMGVNVLGVAKQDLTISMDNVDVADVVEYITLKLDVDVLDVERSFMIINIWENNTLTPFTKV